MSSDPSPQREVGTNKLTTSIARTSGPNIRTRTPRESTLPRGDQGAGGLPDGSEQQIRNLTVPSR